MKKYPVPVLIVAVLFILAGCVGFVYHIYELFATVNSLTETVLVLVLRVVAVVCGLLLLFRISWARWIAIAWLLYHVILSAFHSTAEVITHILFFIFVAVLLFLPVSAKWFGSEVKPA
jgi:hypothetical protein